MSADEFIKKHGENEITKIMKADLQDANPNDSIIRDDILQPKPMADLNVVRNTHAP